jgi:hypothetical protein
MKIVEIINEDRVDEINWRKAAATGATALAAMGAFGKADASDNTRRVSPQADGSMSQSFAQQVAANASKIQVVKPLANDFEQIVYKDANNRFLNGVRDTTDGTIIVKSGADSFQVIKVANGRETTDYVGSRDLGNDTKAALQSITNKSDSQPLAQPTQNVTVKGNTLSYNGKDYNIVKINKDGPQPRLSKFDAKVLVAYPDLGIRSIGSANATLAGDTAYVYMD